MQPSEDRLFEVASVIERLQIIRSMLTILRVSLRDYFESLTQIVNAGCALLVDDSLGTGVIAHIADRLAKLEHNTMMAFIKIAKGETKNPKGRELTKFKERLNMATAALVIDREKLKTYKERCESELEAVDENQPELRSAALYRRDHYANILATVDQCLDVVSILSTGKFA
jgi:hypothetical protein